MQIFFLSRHVKIADASAKHFLSCLAEHFLPSPVDVKQSSFGVQGLVRQWRLFIESAEMGLGGECIA